MREARNFNNDFARSNTPAIRKAWEKLLRKRFGDDIEVIWKDATDTQKGLGLDVTIKTVKGRRFSVELKSRISSCFQQDWVMEIISHAYDKEDKETRIKLYSADGWIYTTTAEYIFHGTLNNSETDFIEAICYTPVPFKTERYKGEFNKYGIMWWRTKYNNKFQLTLNRLIPKSVIKKDAGEFWEWDIHNGCSAISYGNFAEVPKLINKQKVLF